MIQLLQYVVKPMPKGTQVYSAKIAYTRSSKSRVTCGCREPRGGIVFVRVDKTRRVQV
jgi:hypothetical protein